MTEIYPCRRHAVVPDGPVLGLVQPDLAGKYNDVIGSLIVGKKVVSVDPELPLFFIFFAVCRFQVQFTNIPMPKTPKATTRSTFDHTPLQIMQKFLVPRHTLFSLD